MSDLGSSDDATFRGSDHAPGVQTARAQIEAARLRERDLIAAGQLTATMSESVAPLPEKALPGYTILREIHRGGQGVVYQALQQSTNRKVAIKVLLEGAHASKSARQRFDREIELVASLRHPNVISVFHSDQTTDGLRFCVMDYVRGQPITQHVKQSKLTLQDTLRVFAQVCDAVNHAHQKGVIHRDLKPSNILVDVDGIPRVLDFGLAKMLGGAEQSLVSMTGQVVGTLPYMSPEQTRGNPDEIDTRTDVYSLGVLLYEILTGHYPYPVVGPMAEVLRNIAEAEPTPPSQYGWEGSSVAISSRSSFFRSWLRPSSSAAMLSRRSSGIDDDIQTIVLKSLAKERERRYQSAGELSRDISHYLSGEPIEAKRNSFGYAVRKQLRRHRVAVAVSLAFLMLLVGGFATSLTFWYRTEQALKDKESQQQRAESFGGFLKEVLTLADPAKAKGEKLTVREALDKAAKRIDDGSLKNQPLVEAEVRFTIGSTYSSLGMYQQAETQLRTADALQSRGLGGEHPDTLRTRSKLSDAITWESDYAGAAMLAQPTLEAQTRVLGPDHPDTLQTMVILGRVLWAQVGKFPEAETLLQDAVERRKRVLGPNHPETADAMDILGEAYTFNSYSEKAEPLHREALRIHIQAYGEEHPATLSSMYLLAGSLYNQNWAEEAETIQRRVFEIRRRVLGPEHIDTLASQGNLAAALNRMGRYAEAESMYRENLAAVKRTTPTHSNVITTQRYLAGCLDDQRKYPEAEALLREALENALTKYGPEDTDTSIRVMCALASVLAAQRKDAEAEKIARQVLEIQRRQLPRPDLSQLHGSSSALTRVLQRRGAKDEALRVEQELIEYLFAAARAPDAGDKTLDRAAWNLLNPVNKQLRDPPRALQLALQANERSGHKNSRFLVTLAQAYLQTGNLERATETWEQAIALLTHDPARAATLNGAASQLLAVTPETLRDPAVAMKFAQRANELTGHKNPAFLRTLALAYIQTGDSTQASAIWEQASALLSDDPARAQLLNGAAWDLLTVTPETLRDPAAALKFALQANELTGHKNSAYLDSLALAYFRTDDTPKAIEVEKQAIDLLPQDAPDRPEYARQLAEFEAALEKVGGKDVTP